MKAVICTKYGTPDVLQIKEVEKPKPKDNEILIKIHATSVSSGDARLRRADPFAVRLFFGFLKPKKATLGYVFAGKIETAGKDVKLFKEDDKVFGTTGMRMGAYAEYICLPENGVVALKSENMSYEEAAAIPFGGNAALYFLNKGNVNSCSAANRSGIQKALIYGASGSIGTYAVQLAKYFGAEVTGVCSTVNLEMVKSLGADHTIDYTKTDFSKNGATYDVIFDTVGKSSFSNSIGSLKKKGILILAASGLSGMIRGLWTSIISGKKVISGVMSEKAEDLVFFNKLIDTGNIKVVIDRSYTLEQIAEAHAYVDKGHKKGNIVITV